MRHESTSSLSAEYGTLCGHRDANLGTGLYPVPKDTAFGQAYHAAYSRAMARKAPPDQITNGPAYIAALIAFNARGNWIVQSKEGSR